MVDVATKYPSGTPGTYFNDPRLMQRWYEGGAASFGLVQNTTARLNTTANFFAEIALRGAAVDTNWTAAVKKTILTSASPTLLYHVVGPAQAVGDTAVYEIIVDGTTYTLPTTPAAVVGCRTMLGPIEKLAMYTTADVQLNSFANVASTSGWASIFNAVGYIMPDFAFDTLGIPRLFARQSLTVSITVSANITATASQERQAGLQYRVVA